jgi:hypothetical protein
MTLLPILLVSAAGTLAALALWAFLVHQLSARIRSRLRALPLAAPLVMMALGYGVFWLAFFSSPAMAVQMHATWLTIRHAVWPFLPWVAGAWLVAGLWALRPLFSRAA